MYVQELIKEGLTRDQVAQKLCDAVNALYFEYVADKSETSTKEQLPKEAENQKN